MAREGASQVLAVVTRSHTMASLGQTGLLGMEVRSTDIDPDAAKDEVHRLHRIFAITSIDCDTFPVVFDAVLMNGALDCDVNTPKQCRAALVEVFRVLTTRGRLVPGWNSDGCPDVPAIAREQGFHRDGIATRPAPVGFAGSTHLCDVVRRD